MMSAAKRKIKRAGRELLEYLEYFIIPSLAVILPWWLAMRWFRLVSYVPWLYQETTQHCLAGAKYLDLVDVQDESNWVRACKISQMVDYADIFLLMTRSGHYWQKYVDENISQQLLSQQMIFTPHYGAGMWIYQYLLSRQHRAAMLVNLPDKRLLARNLIGRLRLYVLGRLGADIVSPDQMLRLRKVLHNKGTIIVGPDIPVAEGVKSYQPDTPLGQLNLSARFFDLAESHQIPVLNIVFSLDVESGRRQFDAKAYEQKTAKEYAQLFAQQAFEAIKKRSYLWRMLVAAPRVMLRQQ